jgi:hypothetical protein
MMQFDYFIFIHDYFLTATLNHMSMWGAEDDSLPRYIRPAVGGLKV